MRSSLHMLFLFWLLAAQDPSPEKIRELIGKLGDDEYAVRERATRELEAAGEAASHGLAAAVDSIDPEVAWRARQILEEISRRAYSLTLRCPKEFSKTDAIRIEAVFNNRTKSEITLLSEGFKIKVWLVEAHEEPACNGRIFRSTSSARSSRGCLLWESDFATLAGGAEHAWVFGDMKSGTGFDVSDVVAKKYPDISASAPTLAGRYRVVVTYRYDRPSYMGLCLRQCTSHPDPYKPWNRCFDRMLQAETEFVITR